MEDICNSADRLLAKFNESITHSAPKKLKFDMNESLLEHSDTVSRKRRLSQSSDEELPSTSTKNSSSNMEVDGTLSSITKLSASNCSPWEIRRLKADLIEAKTRISNLCKEIDRRNKLHHETETLMENRVNELKKQCDYSAGKIEDLEKHMQVIRKRECSNKQEILKLQTQIQEQKTNYEEKIRKMKSANQEAEENARITQNSLTNELGDYKRHNEQLEMELDMVNNELKLTQQQLFASKNKSSAFDETKLKVETLEQDLLEAETRIKNLEYEISTYNDWKDITNVCQERLLGIPDMTRELERLRTNNKNLQNLIGNKLLLEEEVYDLRKRLNHDENIQTQLLTTQMELQHTKNELNDWIAVAKDHCSSLSSPSIVSTNVITINPITLRKRIEELLKDDIIHKSEMSNQVAKSKSLESELKDYKEKCEIQSKNLEEVKTALIRYKSFKERLQKKLLLVCKERDCYKQLLENFEKDLTISTNLNSTDQSSLEVNQLRCRLDMIEKTLAGYKELCSNLEKELNTVKSIGPSSIGASDSNSQMTNNLINLELNSTGCYEHFKQELDTFRMENQRLRRRKDELELILEHKCLKDNINNYSNYSQQQADNSNMEEMIQNLKSEIDHLKDIIRQMEEEREQLIQSHIQHQQHGTIEDGSNELTNAKNSSTIHTLRNEIDLLNSKIKRMKDCYKSASLEFREVVYMLFGYRIDRIGNNSSYKLSSMYAESTEDFLTFCLNDENFLNLVETPYSTTLNSLIDIHLNENKSVPSFLSALTLDLFQQTTISIS